jgi:hypothetical protein
MSFGHSLINVKLVVHLIELFINIECINMSNFNILKIRKTLNYYQKIFLKIVHSIF